MNLVGRSTRLNGAIIALLLSMAFIAVCSFLPLPSALKTLLFDQGQNSLFTYPFTIQNLIWCTFFVCLGELYCRARHIKGYYSALRSHYLPEEDSIVLTQRDMGALYRDVKPVSNELAGLIKSLVLGDSRLVKKNQSVVTIGFPGASDFDVTDPGFSEPKIKRGVISARHTLRQDSSGASVDWFEHDAIVNSGNSGGPLMDACGRVVGVNVAKASTDIGVGEFVQSLKQGALQLNLQEGTFYSVQINELRQALKAQHIAFKFDSGVCAAPGAGLNAWYLAALGLVALLLLALSVVYLRLRHTALAGKIDTRYVSRLIRSKLMPSRKRLVAEQAHWPDIELARGKRCVVGRDPNHCDAALEQEEISRQHAELRLNARGEVEVRDLGSGNGTYIDHVRVPKGDVPASGGSDPMRLCPGQRLILGSEAVVYRLDQDEPRAKFQHRRRLFWRWRFNGKLKNTMWTCISSIQRGPNSITSKSASTGAQES